MEGAVDPELAALRAKRMAELQRVAEAGPVVVTDASFDAFVAVHPVVVVDCWAAWCPPCRAMSPIIDELSHKWAGKVTFAKLNTDENRETAGRFAIRSIPTLLIFKNGEFIDQIVGLPPKAQLVQMLSPLAG